MLSLNRVGMELQSTCFWAFTNTLYQASWDPGPDHFNLHQWGTGKLHEAVGMSWWNGMVNTTDVDDTRVWTICLCHLLESLYLLGSKVQLYCFHHTKDALTWPYDLLDLIIPSSWWATADLRLLGVPRSNTLYQGTVALQELFSKGRKTSVTEGMTLPPDLRSLHLGVSAIRACQRHQPAFPPGENECRVGLEISRSHGKKKSSVSPLKALSAPICSWDFGGRELEDSWEDSEWKEMKKQEDTLSAMVELHMS